MSTFEVTTDAQSPTAGLVIVRGDVDLATAPQILGVAEGLIDSGVDLTIDMSGVTFIDSTGLGALIKIRNALLERGHHLIVATPSRAVERAVALAGLADVFGVDSEG